MARIVTTATNKAVPAFSPLETEKRLVVTPQLSETQKRLNALENELRELPKDNLAASVNPTATDDESEDYSIGSRWINTVTDREFVCADATEGFAVWVETTAAGGGGGGGSWTQQRFVSGAAQVSFILGAAPVSSTSIIVAVNGVKADGSGVDYTVSGTTLTWLNNEFSLETGDIVSVTYII